MTKQQVDPTTGRVIPTREVVTKDLQKILGWQAVLMSDEYMKILVDYVMQQKNDDYYRGVKLGLSIGRKEMVAAMETVIGEDDQVSEDPKNHNYHSNELRKEQRQRLKAMVGALEKGDSKSPSGGSQS